MRSFSMTDSKRLKFEPTVVMDTRVLTVHENAFHATVKLQRKD